MKHFILTSFFIVSARICQGLTLSGQIAPVYTPLDDTGYLNLTIIPQYARRLAETNVAGAFICGTAGEGPNFNMLERQELFRSWVESNKPYGLLTIAQISGNIPLYDRLSLAQYCESIGVDVIAVLPDLYAKPTAERIVTELKMISDAAPSVPIMFYEAIAFAPAGPGVDVTKLFRLALSTIKQFIGIKTRVGNGITIKAFIPKRGNTAIMVSNYTLTQAANELHFNGTISEASGLFPEIVTEIERAVAVKDDAAAEEAQARLDTLMNIIGDNGKTAIELITGLHMGPPRAPKVGPTYEETRMLSRNLELAGVLLKSPVY